MITTRRSALVMAGLLISLGPPVTVANADGKRVDRDLAHAAEPDTAEPPSTTLAPVAVAPTTSEVNDAKPTAPAAVPPELTPGDFDVNVPAVEHFTYSVIPAQSAVPWVELLDLPNAVEGLAIGVKRDGVGVGTVLIVDDFGLATYVNRLFDAPVTIEHSLPLGEGTQVAASEARAVWQSFGGVAVVAATAPDDGVGQWVWGHDGIVWIAFGSLAMADLITGLVGAQQLATPSDPYDHALAGPLYQRWLQAVPGYLFVDLPVAATLEQMPSTLAGDCAQRLYLGHVEPADDPDPLVMAPDDLALVAATISGVCADRGFFANLDAALDSMALRRDVIDGVPVRRDETNIVVVDGNDVIHLSSGDPATLVEMAPLITQLVTRHRNLEVVDFNALTVGTCLFRGAQRSDDPEDRPVYVTDCATPHQGEVFHELTFESPPGATYPGDASVSVLADQICVDAFAGYVGIDFASSRLNFLYFYPSAETWSDGDRDVTCILYGSDPEELLRGSVAGTAQ